MPLSIPGNSCVNCGSRASTQCLFTLSDFCVYYAGANISGPGINTGDNLDSVINKLVGFTTGLPVVTSLTTQVLSSTVSSYIYTGSTPATWTMPSISLLIGKQFILKNRGSGIVTINAAGSDNFYTTVPIASLTLSPGDSYSLLDDGTYWNVI